MNESTKFYYFTHKLHKAIMKIMVLTNNHASLSSNHDVKFFTLCYNLFARGRYKAEYFLCITAVLLTL